MIRRMKKEKVNYEKAYKKCQKQSISQQETIRELKDRWIFTKEMVAILLVFIISGFYLACMVTAGEAIQEIVFDTWEGISFLVLLMFSAMGLIFLIAYLFRMADDEGNDSDGDCKKS